MDVCCRKNTHTNTRGIMSLGICSLASGSTGNCYLIKSDEAVIILDVGISVKRIKENLELKGIYLKEVDAILVTHEHIDHVKSLKSLIKKTPHAKVYLSHGTCEGIREKYDDIATEFMLLNNTSDEKRVIEVRPGESFEVNDVRVNPFRVSHDTIEPVAFTFKVDEPRGEKDFKCISVVTDTGVITDEIFEAVRESDIMMIESNHEPEILLYGRYPYPLKRRILSDMGHLSNEACAECLIRVLNEKTAKLGGKDKIDDSNILRVFLAHLSQENNTPDQAMITASNILEEAGYYVGRHLTLETLRKDQATRMIYA